MGRFIQRVPVTLYRMVQRVARHLVYSGDRGLGIRTGPLEGGCKRLHQSAFGHMRMRGPLRMEQRSHKKRNCGGHPPNHQSLAGRAPPGTERPEAFQRADREKCYHSQRG